VKGCILHGVSKSFLVDGREIRDVLQILALSPFRAEEFPEDARTLYGWTHFIHRLVPEDLETMEEDIDFMLQNGMLAKKIAPESCIAPFALP